jgi:hypothetical protein
VTEVVVQGTLKADGTLQLSQPVNLPPGQVRVIVQTMPVAPHGPANPMAVLQRIWAERKALGIPGRTAPQIDADIQSLRDEWEDHQRELDRVQDEARHIKE